MDNQFAGQLNGKQKAWGFIVLLPLYFYVIPAVVNFVIYMLVKYGVLPVDQNMLGVYLNLFSGLLSLICAYVIFKDFIKDNFIKFKEHLFENVAWSMTFGIASVYIFSIIANIIINLLIDTSSHSAANQTLFETYLGSSMLWMIVQSVIIAPMLEEFIFRGLIFRTLRKYNKVLAHIVSSFVFGFIHIYTGLFAGDLSQLAYLFSYGLMGFAFSIAYEKKGTIFVPITIHMLNNFIAVAIIVFQSIFH